MVEIVYKNALKQKQDVGVAKSILAGVGSGIFKIFEGGATLGATLLDLGVDKNRAEAVEAYFDEINPKKLKDLLKVLEQEGLLRVYL